MTVEEAIKTVTDLYASQYTQEQMLSWLSQLDGQIQKEIIDTHEGGTDIDFGGYCIHDKDCVLLAPPPFDRMYLSYLESRIHYANAEYGKYNNAIALFQADYSAYWNWYNRTHRPKTTAMRYI